MRVYGRPLAGWYVLDLDAIIVPCTSAEEGAVGTGKGSFGRMPLGARAASCRRTACMQRRVRADVQDLGSQPAVAVPTLASPPPPPPSMAVRPVNDGGDEGVVAEDLAPLI